VTLFSWASLYESISQKRMPDLNWICSQRRILNALNIVVLVFGFSFQFSCYNQHLEWWPSYKVLLWSFSLFLCSLLHMDHHHIAQTWFWELTDIFLCSQMEQRILPMGTPALQSQWQCFIVGDLLPLQLWVFFAFWGVRDQYGTKQHHWVTV